MTARRRHTGSRVGRTVVANEFSLGVGLVPMRRLPWARESEAVALL